MPNPIINRAVRNGETLDNIQVNSNFWKLGVIREKVVIGTAAANATLKQVLPKNSRVIACQMNFDTAITLATGTEVGLGITGDPDSFLESTTTVTKNTKVTGAPLTTNFVTAATPILVASTNGSGTAAGTLLGEISVQIVYIEMPDLANAD